MLAGTFLASVGDLGCEIVAIGDARDSSTIGRTMLTQDIVKIPLMGLLCALETKSRFFVVVLSLFLYARVVMCNHWALWVYVDHHGDHLVGCRRFSLLELCFLEGHTRLRGVRRDVLVQHCDFETPGGRVRVAGRGSRMFRFAM